MQAEKKIAIFKSRRIRREVYNNEWWFSVVDVCEALTDSVNAGAYWRKLKQRLQEEGSEAVTFCHGLKLIAPEEKIAGDARNALEKRLKRSIVSAHNYLKEKESQKRIKQ